MAHIMIQQPNGKFTIWSTCIDAPVAYDLTEKEVIEYEAKEAYEIAKEDISRYFKLNKFKRSNYLEDCTIMWDNMDEPTQKAFSKIFGITKEEYEEEMEMEFSEWTLMYIAKKIYSLEAKMI